MPDVQKCPHCHAEITEDDMRNEVLFEQFCETGLYKDISKKADWWFMSGLVLVYITALAALILGVFLVDTWSVSPLWFIIMLCGLSGGLICVSIGFKYESKRDKLSQEYKKLRE